MDPVELLIDHQRIVDAVTDLFIATDRRDWPVVLGCFAPEVAFDMSSLGAGAPGTVPAKQIVAGWEKGLAPLKAIHHQVGNFKVSIQGQEATAFCYGIASHYLPHPTGRSTRTFVGSYDFRLARDGSRWRITMFRFNLKYVDGNPDLEKQG